MKLRTLVTSIALALLGSAVAQVTTAADLYKWTDEKGQVHYTSSPPPETARKPQQIDPANPSNATALPTSAAAQGAASAPGVLFILDASGSMKAKIDNREKIVIAKEVMSNLLRDLPATIRVGLEVYGHHTKGDCNDIEVMAPVGQADKAALIQRIQAIDPKGMTPITQALQVAAEQLKTAEQDTTVVLVSDGEETCKGDPCAAVASLLQQGIKLKVHVVGFDVAEKEQQQLMCIAKAGNGRYFTANNAEQLKDALTEVKQEVVKKIDVGVTNIIGCADGKREGFADIKEFPDIAGCNASWEGVANLRAPATGNACGNDLKPCKVPADACAPGWHICGQDGSIEEISRIGAERCANAGDGRYVAAISHCKTQSGCVYDNGDGHYPCFSSGWCSEAVCCGKECGDFGICRDGVWPNATHIAIGMDQGCGAMLSHRAQGVLCCKDRVETQEVVKKAEVPPPPPVVAQTPPPPAPEKKVVKLAIGTIKIPNLQSDYVSVYEQQTGKKLGDLWKGRTLDVPAGTYKIQFGDMYLEGIEVTSGQTTERLVGIIGIPKMQPDYVGVYEQQTGKKVGDIWRGGKLNVPPGTYKFEVSGQPVEIQVEGGQEVVIE